MPIRRIAVCNYAERHLSRKQWGFRGIVPLAGSGPNWRDVRFGGQGRIYGTLVGSVIIGRVETGIIGAGCSGYWTGLAYGVSNSRYYRAILP